MNTPNDQIATIDTIKTFAKARHERARKAAAARGRKDFPSLPIECSWAFEERFRRGEVNLSEYQPKRSIWSSVPIIRGAAYLAQFDTPQHCCHRLPLL